MSNNRDPANKLLEFHEERIGEAEIRLADLEAYRMTHEEVDNLRFSQLSDKLDDLGCRIMSKMDIIQEDLSILKDHDNIQDLKLQEIRSVDKERKQIRSTLMKFIWPGIAVISVEIGHRILSMFGE